MSGDKLKEAQRIKKTQNNRAVTYDEWYKSFEGAVENYVDWELLKQYLPKNKN